MQDTHPPPPRLPRMRGGGVNDPPPDPRPDRPPPPVNSRRKDTDVGYRPLPPPRMSIPKVEPPYPWPPPPKVGGGVDVPAHYAWMLMYEEGHARSFLISQFRAGYVPEWRPWARPG